MRLTKVSRFYDMLTPWERVPLLEAARQQGDPGEVGCLTRSAPRKGWQVADYFGLDQALRELAARYTIAQLDVAARFWKLSALSERRLVSRRPKRNPKEARQALRMLAHACVTRAEGLKLLGEELAIDMDPMLREWPGYETVRAIEETTRFLAFSHEEALAFFRAQANGSVSASADGESETLIGAPDMAAAMRQFLEEGLEEWS